MKKIILTFAAAIAALGAMAQISAKRYTNNCSAAIGTCYGVSVREGGFSGLCYIPGTQLEFYTVSDRGFSLDASEKKDKDKTKIVPFPDYSPKIHRIRLAGDSIQILQTMTVKRPDGTNATGLPLPKGKGHTGEKLVRHDAGNKLVPLTSQTDEWGVDPEGICMGHDNTFWICEEFGTSIWHLDATGKVIRRYSPYGNGDHQTAIDTIFKHRRPNHGFEGVAITPKGKVYGFVQNTIPFPDKEVLESTRIHRISEIDPVTNKTRVFAYVNDGLIKSGDDKIKPDGIEIGDAAAINDSEFLVIEHKVKKSISHMVIYRVNIAGATPLPAEWIKGKTIEQYNDEAGLTSVGIKPVKKTKFMDLSAENGYDISLSKTEDLAIINDSTIAVGIDNDYGVESDPKKVIAESGIKPVIYVFSLKGNNKIERYVAPAYGNRADN